MGLHELRQALGRVTQDAQRFEQALRALPACDACAHATLLEYIGKTGRRLGSEAANLAILAETIKRAVATAEAAQARLTMTAPAPYRCQSEPCACHD